MNRIRQILSALGAGGLGWIVFASVIWGFLFAPYAVAAYECATDDTELRKIQCLKPVAQRLRNDSNIATYATATVAAIIALQLANRNRVDASRRDSSLDK